MKKENFGNALTQVNGDYIAEAAQYTEKKKRGIPWKVITAAAALAACFVLTVNAAVPVDLGFYLSAAFGDGYEVISDMVSMPDHVAYRSSGDEITLELKGIVGDGHVVKAFVDLTVAADTEIPEGLGKGAEFAMFNLELKPAGLPWEQHISSYGDSRGNLAKTVNEDGSITFSYVLTLQSEDELIGGKYIVSCTEMKYYDCGIEDTRIVLTGEWNLGFSLAYYDISERITVAEDGNEICDIVLSPLSLGIFWNGESEYHNIFTRYANDARITMADGSEIVWKDFYETEEIGRFRLTDDGRWYTVDDSEIAPIYITNRLTGFRDDGTDYIILTFDAPLDTENVKSVTIGGVEIVLK